MNPAKSFTSPPPRRSEKIRQSCDNCGISKIKCGRQHPRCLNCLQHGLACSYPPSKRAGKRSATSSGRGARRWSENSARSPTQNVTAAEPSSFWSEAIADAPIREEDESAFDVMAIKKSSLVFPVDMDAQGHDISGQNLPVIPGFEYDIRHDLNLDFDALCGSSTPSAFLACMPNEMSDTTPRNDGTVSSQSHDVGLAGSSSRFLSLSEPVSTHPLRARDLKGRLQDIEPCSSHSKACMISALKILQALHMPPSMCLSAGVEGSDSDCPQPRMTDFVLSTNKEIVRLIVDILECTCSLSSQVQLVLTIICDKLTAWYRAIIRDDHNSFNNAASVLDNQQTTSGESHVERVLHQPITIGEYAFDVTLENKIRAQMIYGELEHVESLITRLSKRVEESNFGNVANAVTAANESSRLTSNSKLAETIRRNQNAFLQERLQAAKTEANVILDSGHESEGVSRQSSVSEA